ncbi:hypothetical protein [Halarcobacter sp.]|uniref:hypothetical protein n=1 Tax=Halarcobacter sp. TaxID=2321133 RepID=UPI002AAC4563|nr:hypothetical protein [Halarcobacter sp.]
MKFNTLNKFFKYSGIYFYLFILIVILLIVNKITSDDELYNKILNSSSYVQSSSYNKNSLIYITDTIKVKGNITDEDNIYNLNDAVLLRKKVEMYSWVRKFINKHISYEKSWETQFSEKPSLLTDNYNNPWPRKKLGVFYYYPDSIYLSNIKIPTIKFKADKYINVQLKNSQLNKNDGLYYLYFGKSNLNTPQVGDIRIRYELYKANQKTTIFFTYSDGNINFQDEIVKSIYNKNLFLTFFRGDKKDVLNSFLDNELKWKSLLQLLLSYSLFIPVFKMLIVIFNMNLKKEISSTLLKNLIVFLIIIPSSILVTYLIVKIISIFTY